MAKKTSKIATKKKAAPKATKTEKSVKIIKPVKVMKDIAKTAAVVPEKEEEKDENAPISKEVEKALEEVDEKIDDPEVPAIEEIPDVMTEEDFSPDIDDADEKEEW